MVTLEFENPFGYEDSLVVELMRSTEWLQANNVEVGGTVRLAFEELKVDDDGYVRSISSCPVIAQGDGCVVTGTFTHLNSDVLELTFADSDLVLQPTALHPLWSEDRNDWVRAGLLRVGEHLRSESGPLEIATIQWVDGTHQVFNLEVAGNHTYLVGAEAVLSHNAENCGARFFVTKAGEVLDGQFQFGAFKSAKKWLNQMEKRGWSEAQISEAIAGGERFAAENLVNKGNSATRFVHPESGQSVVLDNVTKEVIHVGGPNFAY